MKIRSFLLAMMLCALCCVPAHALEYCFDAPEDYLFGQPTSDDTIYEWENPNVDRSKNTALAAPGFGSPTSYLPGSGEKVSVNDSSGTASTTDNRVTLYTCVMNQPEYRWCVTAVQQG